MIEDSNKAKQCCKSRTGCVYNPVSPAVSHLLQLAYNILNHRRPVFDTIQQTLHIFQQQPWDSSLVIKCSLEQPKHMLNKASALRRQILVGQLHAFLTVKSR